MINTYMINYKQCGGESRQLPLYQGGEGGGSARVPLASVVNTTPVKIQLMQLIQNTKY